MTTRVLLRGKLHRATVTLCDLHYEGSCGIDADLLKAADILPNERVEIYNVNNGERFSTYAIVEPAGSGAITLNGAAARRVQLGDLLIICTYGSFNETESHMHKPKVVLLGEGNKITGTK